MDVVLLQIPIHWTQTMKQLQIVFLGVERVGKTSAIQRFLYGSFEDVTESTLGHCYNETIFLPSE